MQVAGIALVFRLGPKPGDTPPLVVGVERQVQADRVVDAAHETHTRVGLLFHDVSPPASRIIALAFVLSKPFRRRAVQGILASRRGLVYNWQREAIR